MDERDFLPASIRSGANFDVYPQFSRIEDRVASPKDFCTEEEEQNLFHTNNEFTFDFSIIRIKPVFKYNILQTIYTSKFS